MPELKIVEARLSYEIIPDYEWMQAFTSSKQNAWGQCRHGVDEYVRSELEKHTSQATGLPRALMATLRGAEYQENLVAQIYGEVNRGWGIIITAPDAVEILTKAPYQVINEQVFEQAIGQLITSIMRVSKKGLRDRRVKCREWADACAYFMLRAVSRKFV